MAENAIARIENYYLLAVDRRDYSALSKIFAKDAEVDYGPGMGAFQGFEALAAALEKA